MFNFQSARDIYKKKKSIRFLKEKENLFEKLNSLSIDHIFKFFNLKELVLYSFISKMFKNKLLTYLSFTDTHYPLFLKYWKQYYALFQIQKKFPFQYVNVILGKNIFNIKEKHKKLSIEEGKEIQIKSITFFLYYLINITKKTKIFVSVNSYENYSIYFYVLLNLSKYFDDLKVTISFPFYLENFVYFTNLFKLIKEIKPAKNERDISHFLYIQELLLEGNSEIDFDRYYLSKNNLQKSLNYYLIHQNKIKKLIFIDSPKNTNTNANENEMKQIIQKIIKLNHNSINDIKNIQVLEDNTIHFEALKNVNNCKLQIEILSKKSLSSLVELSFITISVDSNTKTLTKLINSCVKLQKIGIISYDIKKTIDMLTKIKLPNIYDILLKNESSISLKGELLKTLSDSKNTLKEKLIYLKEEYNIIPQNELFISDKLSFSLPDDSLNNHNISCLKQIINKHLANYQNEINILIRSNDYTSIISLLQLFSKFKINSLDIISSKFSMKEKMHFNTLNYTEYSSHYQIIEIKNENSFELIEKGKPKVIILNNIYHLAIEKYEIIKNNPHIKIVFIKNELIDYEEYQKIKILLNNKIVHKLD